MLQGVKSQYAASALSQLLLEEEWKRTLLDTGTKVGQSPQLIPRWRVFRIGNGSPEFLTEAVLDWRVVEDMEAC